MYQTFERKIGYTFRNKNYLAQAFTHSSYAYENKMQPFENNERLEFLGDAVLELTISNFLYQKHPQMSEGELTKLRASTVCEPTLAQNARVLGIGEHMCFGKGEEQTGGRERDSILADAFESVIGAIYLDGGLENAERFILNMLADDVNRFENPKVITDYKTTLQEEYQKFSQVPLKYTIVEESGPAHNRQFTAQLTHGDQILGTGKGKSKKEAEQNAAFQALEKVKIDKV